MKQFYEKKEKKKNKKCIKHNLNNFKKINLNNNLLINLFKSKNHLGTSIRESNSCSFKYLYGQRFGQSIIKLEYTVSSLKRCFLIIKNLLKKKKTILIICNDFKIDFLKSNLLREFKKTKYSRYIKILENSWQEGTFTKNKNKIDFSLILCFNNKNNDFLIKEAIISKIPVISLTDTNKNPNLINYPILSNNTNIKSLYFFICLFKNFIKNLK